MKNIQYFYDTMSSPFGEILLVSSEEGFKKLEFKHSDQEFKIDDNWLNNENRLKEARLQLEAYFAKKLTKFDLELAPEGTVFQKQIWNQLIEIPYGELRSYQDIANAINKPNACRAVGMANSQNPIPIIIPCHRVIGKNGKLTGYAGGLENKAKLLRIEGITQGNSPLQFQLF